jgi:hypothetical protein
MSQKLLVRGVIIAALLSSGCTKAIIFATSTRTGIEINAGEGGRAHAKIGFERIEALLAPMTERDGKLRGEAPSALALYDLRQGESGVAVAGADAPVNTRFGLVRLRQVFATGRAALPDSSAQAMQALQSGLLPEAVVGDAEALIRAIEDTPADQWPTSALLAAVRSELPGGAAVSTKTEARDLVRKIAEDPASRQALAEARRALGPSN